METRTFLARLRDGHRVGKEDLAEFAIGLADGSVSDAQAGAFAMAAVLRGLGERGAIHLTEAMRDSGHVMNWSLNGPVVDKHSTGGLGDCVSLLLAPMLAAAGVYVPMISGRGLGHTGGTLDKLEAIPGVDTRMEEDRFRAIVENVGCAIVAASADLAPADRRLYAVRDVSATVESIELITASILSKKLAAGLDALVLDVKTGSGAFMSTMEDARRLAQSLVSTANGAGCKTSALITDMNQPLAASVGNAVEVSEVIGVLTGTSVSAGLSDLSIDLGGEILALVGTASDADDGARIMRDVLRRGLAAEKFAAMVSALGGNGGVIEANKRILPKAPVVGDVTAPKSGYVAAIDGRAVGMAVVELGGGRQVETDQIDPSVGFSSFIRIGQVVRPGDPLATVHAADENAAERAAIALQKAVVISETPTEPPSLIYDRVD